MLVPKASGRTAQGGTEGPRKTCPLRSRPSGSSVGAQTCARASSPCACQRTPTQSLAPLCLLLSRGYATKHVVEGLEPRTLYRFRLKVTSPSGEYEYSPVVSVSTTSEYATPASPVIKDSRRQQAGWGAPRPAFGAALPGAGLIPLSNTVMTWCPGGAWPSSRTSGCAVRQRWSVPALPWVHTRCKSMAASLRTRAGASDLARRPRLPLLILREAGLVGVLSPLGNCSVCDLT